MGGIAFVEDVKGKGQLTRMLSTVTLLFLARQTIRRRGLGQRPAA